MIIFEVISAIIVVMIGIALMLMLVSYIKKYKATPEEERRFFEEYNLDRDMTDAEKRKYIAAYSDSTDEMYQKMQAKKKK